MKAFKGCTNPDCIAYKKVHYKKTDAFCLKCGNPLSFVCAECWKPMEDGKEKFCISCSAEKEQHRAEIWDAVKKVGGGVTTSGAFVVAAPKMLKDSDKLVKGAKKAAVAVAEVIKLAKK